MSIIKDRKNFSEIFYTFQIVTIQSQQILRFGGERTRSENKHRGLTRERKWRPPRNRLYAILRNAL